MPNHLFYFNALFDHHIGGADVDKVARGAAEMTALFAPCGTVNDRVLLDIEVPSGYWEYLDECDVAHATAHAGADGALPVAIAGCPWGWDRDAVMRLQELGAKCTYPDLDVVARVNSRQFCSGLAPRLGIGVPGSAFCRARSEVESALSRPDAVFPQVVKPAFGGSGAGFVVLESRDSADVAFWQRVGHYLRSGVVVEPWIARVHDISSSLDLSGDGHWGEIRHYRCFVNAAGAFYGVLLQPDDPVVGVWARTLGRHAAAVASAVAQTGYFGPLGFDSFVYGSSDGSERLAPIIEINARHVISDIARSLVRSCAPDRCCYYRLAGYRRCRLPESYPEWFAMIDGDRFDPRSRTGVIAVTPLRLKHQHTAWRQPRRSAFFLAAQTENELFAMDQRLRTRLAPSPLS